MTQANRDPLAALKKANKKAITQREAAGELDVSVVLRKDSYSCSAYVIKVSGVPDHAE